MQSQSKRVLQPGNEYDHLFPRPERTDPYLKDGAHTFGVEDSVQLVREVADKYRSDVAKLAPLLKGSTLQDTCKKLWHFIYRHIQYKIDVPGIEQVRRPARSWADRKSGVDCDCYSTFKSAVLNVLGIDHVLRITKYNGKAHYQHIYVIVPTNWSAYRANPTDPANYITIDCVTDHFNHEVPFSDYKDYIIMQGQFLNGLEGDGYLSTLQEDYSIGELGRASRKSGGSRRGAAPAIKQAAQAAAAQTNNNPEAVKQAVVQAADNVVKRGRLNNHGTLKNGDKLELSEEIDRREAGFVVPYGGSMNGKTVYNKFIIRNGQRTDVSLARFISVNGRATGVKANGTLFTDFGDGRGFRQIPGANITNPGVALGDLDNGYTLNAQFSVDGLDNVTFNPGASRPGMFIPAPIFRELLQKRAAEMKKMGFSGLGQGLGAVGALLSGNLGSVLDGLEEIISGIGDLGELGTVNGLEGYMGDIALLGVTDLGAPAQYLPDEDAVTVVDGFGRLKSARVSSRSRRGKAATPAAAAPAPASAAPAAKVNELGVYIPYNTLVNILMYRRWALSKMGSEGLKVNDGGVPLSINGLGGINGLDGLDALVDSNYSAWETMEGLGFFKKLTQTIKKVTDKAADLARKGVKIPLISNAMSVLPGGAIAAKAITASEMFVPKPGGGGPALITNGVAPMAVAPAASADQSARDAYEARLKQHVLDTGSAMQALQPATAQAALEESIAAYRRNHNDGLDGLEGVGNVITWAKDNPILAGAGIAATGVAAYYGIKALTGGSGSSKRKGKTAGLGGVRKGKGTKKRGPAKSGSKVKGAKKGNGLPTIKAAQLR